jgi:mono/diheme cytochrome c family protein
MCSQLAFRESAFCALVLLLAAGQPARGQTIGGDYGPADIAYGARLYTMHCAQCHGATGDQVGTVDLRSGKFKNASTDPQQSSMPAYSGKLTSAEVADPGGISSYAQRWLISLTQARCHEGKTCDRRDILPAELCPRTFCTFWRELSSPR